MRVLTILANWSSLPYCILRDRALDAQALLPDYERTRRDRCGAGNKAGAVPTLAKIAVAPEVRHGPHATIALADASKSPQARQDKDA